MNVIKKEGEFGPTILFYEENKILKFTFGGNGDLYWTIHCKNESDEKSFVITKENYSVYTLFEQLFSDIENINIFDTDSIPFYIETEEEKEEYLKKREKQIEKEKNGYRLFNCSNYNELYDSDSKTITWYSDETAHEVANILKIKKIDDTFVIGFYIQPYVKGYDKDFYSANHIPIRFRNSGSSYDPFNMVFMRMYNNMHDLDDINDIGHQVHIEEYLHSKEKKLTKSFIR